MAKNKKPSSPAAGETAADVDDAPETGAKGRRRGKAKSRKKENVIWEYTKAIGTAWHRFVGLYIPVAGKTGTAEVGGPDTEPHSWFAAYAPADDPEIAIAVIVENAGEGSTVAAPLTRQVVEAYYGLPLSRLPAQAEEDYVPPTPTPQP